MQQLLFRNGGKRRGAGRKPGGPRAGTTHDARPTVKPYHALHVTLRVMPDVASLRRPAMYKVIRAASALTARRAAFRIVHLSIQRTHLHLIVEANDKRALARGLQGFQISVARQVNKLHERHGRVFADRYHLVLIKSPTQMRRVLSYVLCNWHKHGDDRSAPRGWLVDPYSTGSLFHGWKECARGAVLWPSAKAHDWIVVRPACSWVLTTGWRLGGEVSVYDVPGQRPD